MAEQNTVQKKRKNKTRDAIILAARDVFMEMGIAKAFIQEIAKRAGVSRPSVYRNFNSIYHLAVDVELLMFEEAAEEYKNHHDTKTESIADFRRHYHEYADLLINNPSFIRYCINFDQVFADSDFPAELREEFRSRAADIHFFQNMNEALGRVIRPGIDPEDAVILLNESIMGIIQKMTVSRYHPIWTEKYQVGKITHQMLDLLLDGLCRRDE